MKAEINFPEYENVGATTDLNCVYHPWSFCLACFFKKFKINFNYTVPFIRTKISFALPRSSVLCLRGCRATRRQQAIIESSISTIVHEGGLS